MDDSILRMMAGIGVIFDNELFREITLSGLTIGLAVFGLWYFLIKIINLSL